MSNVKTVYFETDLTDQIRLAAKEISIAEYLGCDKDMEKEDLNRLAAKEMSIAEIPGCDKDAEKEDLMPEGVTYESLFDSVAQYQEVHQFLSQKMGVAEYWKRTPKYWFDLLSEYNSTKMYYGIRTADVVLYQEAIKRGIEIGQLESALQHVQWEKGPIIPKTRRQRPNIPLKYQAWMLYIGIHNNNDEIPEWVKGIEAAYLENDTCSLYDVLENHAKNDPDNPMMPNPLIPDSLSLTQAMNQAWFPVIEQNIAKGSCMVAVGARHLLGNKGLIAMLRRKGYTVRQIIQSSMEEIKLYHKVWMALPPLLILLGLSIVFLIPITKGLNQRFWIWNWSLLLLSGGTFLWGLSVLIRERVLHIPPIIIKEDKVIVGKKEYNFADIHHFDLAYLSKSDVIRIH